MNAKKLYILLLWLCIPSLLLATQVDVYPFQREQDRRVFYSLTQELRCVVCQNQSLAESEAPLAKDLRRDIYVQIKQGYSKERIRAYLSTRYGNFILYSPPLQPNTYLLWFFPVILIFITITVLSVMYYRAKTSAASQVS